MTIINDIRIKDRNVHNLPENRDLLGYARNHRKAGNMAFASDPFCRIFK